MDKEHRKYKPNSEFENTLKDYYKYVDKNLGELIKLLDKNTKIIILSDHGITRMHNRVNLADWLIKEGYMVLKESVTEKTRFNFKMVDWNKTRVFAIGAYDGQVFINLKGREPEGIVDSLEYNNLIKELEEKIKAIPGDDGAELQTKIYIKKRDYDGKMIEIAPDMIIYFDDLQYGCNSTLIGNETLWSPSTAQGSDDAAHSRQGIFIMKDVEKGNLGEVSYLDIAPTILNGLGLETPEEMKGEVIE
jgi:predicted AlkP superfamily phosphohydrolase/phosphomutase